MKIHQYHKEEYYSTICDWWKKHNFPILDINFLPENCFAVKKVINNKADILYFIFTYRTDSKLAWVAFPVSNPYLSKEEKQGGLEFLINGVSEILKESGFKYVFTTSPIPSVQTALLNTGFSLGDEKANHYLKNL